MSEELKSGYKKSEIGPIPLTWESVKLGEIFKFKNGLNKGKEFFGYGTPIVNYMDVYKISGLCFCDLKGRVTVSKFEQKAFDVKKGDVFFTRTSETVDEVGIASVMLDEATNTVFSGFVLRARSYSDRLDDHFKKYCFGTHGVRRQITSAASYTTRALTNGRLLSDVVIACPPVSEQCAIAAALFDVDALLAKLDALIVKKRDLKQAAMQQLLTGQTRLPGFGGTAGYLQTDVGLIPEDWEVRTFRDICMKIQDGTHFSPTPGGNDYLYITSKNIGHGALDVTSADRISATEHENIYGRCDVKRGDLLLTKDGANTGNAAINTLDEPFSLLSSVAFLRFDCRLHSAQFFLYQILSQSGQRRLKLEMSGNAITRLTLTKINALRIPVASINEQTAIATILSDMDAEITALEARRDKTRDLKQGMMQELLTGRIRLV
ncbi:restriction endonuclease subunit S [uncultured Lamprocystis sp.]|uniref:restriction endonuclease subunit S n=1 Tax=uncultured Lamprocystis sp. TaxID=543132 RepID=UPI0025E856DC|nr:restriction endonuclease subunit S [uncultured Lamprocystis sp.]